MVAACF